jgi:hypothetical protein
MMRHRLHPCRMVSLLAAALGISIFSAIAFAPVASAVPSARAVKSLSMRPRSGTALVALGQLQNPNRGPVQTTPEIYLDFWGWTSDPSGEQTYLTNFLSAVGGTPWLNTVGQYGAGNQVSLLRGSWSDPRPIPVQPTDDQIRGEAVNALQHFGIAPTVNTQIVVATPTGHSTSGFGPSFCAYHGTFVSPFIFSGNVSVMLTYTNLPYITDAGAACGANAVNTSTGLLDGVSIVDTSSRRRSRILSGTHGGTRPARRSGTSARGP